MSDKNKFPVGFAPDPGALEVLEAFAQSARVVFDRIVAGRVLGEAQRAVDGQDVASSARRMVDAGEVLHLRVRYVECTLEDALAFVRQGIPVAYCHQLADESLQWRVLSGAKGRRLKLAALQPAVAESWVTVGELRRLLRLQSNNSRSRWLIGQPALGCQAPDPLMRGSTGEKPITPLARLFGLLLPEKKDLWVVLIFSLMMGLLALATPVAVEALVNTVAFGRYLQPVVILALLLFTFLAFAAAMRGLTTFIVEILQRRLFIRVVEDLAHRLPRVEQREFDTRYGPELVNRFFDVVTVQKSAASLLLDGLAIVLQTVIGMAVLAFYHPFLLGFDIALLALIAFAVFALGRGAVATAIYESKAKYAVESWLEELARNTTAFKLHAGNKFAIDRADQLAVSWLEARRAHFHIVIRQILFALGLQAVAATALLGLGGWLVILGELTLGQLVAAELIVMMIVGSFAKLGKHMESFYDLLAAVDKLGQLFDLQTEDQRERLFHLSDATPARVSLSNVGYAYHKKNVLEKISIRFEPGDTVAIVGKPAAGKSTLIDLISGLRTPTTGHIELDGIDMREIRPDSLREHLAAARAIEVFVGTVEENVHFNRGHIRASDVRDALLLVDLLDEIMSLPEGLNSKLLTGGFPLSNSQALRLMLARAIVGRPRLLLIDGTLDELPDEMAEKVLARLMKADIPWTILLTTGRQHLREMCSRVVSLEANCSDNPYSKTRVSS